MPWRLLTERQVNRLSPLLRARSQSLKFEFDKMGNVAQRIRVPKGVPRAVFVATYTDDFKSKRPFERFRKSK